MLRCLYASLGTVSVALGVLGLFLPVLPSTPFLLLAAYFFARGSRRLHEWLLRHRHLGPYIHAWRNKTGLTSMQKLRIGTSFSVLMGISVAFCPDTVWGQRARVFLTTVWAFWIFMLWRLKSAEIVLPGSAAARAPDVEPAN